MNSRFLLPVLLGGLVISNLVVRAEGPATPAPDILAVERRYVPATSLPDDG